MFLYERKESPSLERKAFVKFLLEFDLTSTFQETTAGGQAMNFSLGSLFIDKDGSVKLELNS